VGFIGPKATIYNGTVLSALMWIGSMIFLIVHFATDRPA